MRYFLILRVCGYSCGSSPTCESVRSSALDVERLSLETWGPLETRFSSVSVRIATYLGIQMHYLFFVHHEHLGQTRSQACLSCDCEARVGFRCGEQLTKKTEQHGEGHGNDLALFNALAPRRSSDGSKRLTQHPDRSASRGIQYQVGSSLRLAETSDHRRSFSACFSRR
jgi:hypothetical protein